MRYFYPARRAHHAFTMAIDFGMEFEKRFGKWDTESLIELRHATNYKLYIHPDSLHLLAPRKGDLIQSGESLTRFGNGLIALEGFHADATAKIIQRDGLPFHWPECEE